MDTGLEIIVFGGGCFWCTEAVFKMVDGVQSVVPGYSGGDTKDPTYKQVSLGKTGHAEAVQITFDPSKVRVADLLIIFFGSHDPTTLNKQGADIGTQYRSIIFYTTPEQKIEIEEYIQEINESSLLGSPVVTEVAKLDRFYEAENYHKDYFERNKENPYCSVVINPKLKKIQKKYSNLLKQIYEK